jgi:PTH1 family peptidyl-tRNA hydrolase
MRIIIGLGNPGKKYENNRHNLGFMVVEELARKWTQKEVKWQENKKSSSLILYPKPKKEASLEDTLLAKPQSFMNASGLAVAKLAQFYKVGPSDIWVIHDDVDIPLGKIKIRRGGAAAGHHGVESVIRELGTDKFLRFRLGIGHPGRGRDSQVEKYVLRAFDINERTELRHMIKQAVQAIEVAIKDGIEKAMNQFNR